MRLMVFGAAFAAMTLPALAQDNDRYALEKTENGYVRMDKQTGEVSNCETRGAQLVCTLAADERGSLLAEIDSLQEKIAGLDRRIAAVEKSAPALTLPGLPSDAEFEKTLGFMERFFRRFMDIVKDLDKDFRGSEPEGTPQRT